jgi:hypothetical protein
MPTNKPQNKPQQKAPAQKSADVDVSPGGQTAGIQLPPALANLLTTLRDDRKALLKEKPVSDEATTKFLAHFLYPRLIESVEILGVGLSETYGVASQAFTETLRMREYVDRKVEDAADRAEEGTVNVDEDDLDLLRQALAALGLLLQSKAPNDIEIQTAFNLVTEAFTAVAGDGAVDAEDDEDEDEEDEGEDEDEDDGGPASGGRA